MITVCDSMLYSAMVSSTVPFHCRVNVDVLLEILLLWTLLIAVLVTRLGMAIGHVTIVRRCVIVIRLCFVLISSRCAGLIAHRRRCSVAVTF